MTCWLNGAFREEADAINVADRGLLLGDGVFETVLLADGVPAFWDAHMARLGDALAALSIPARPQDFALEAVKELAARCGVSEGAAVLRITVTRGAGARGLAPPPALAPTLLMTAQPYAPPPDVPFRLIVSEYRRSACSLSSAYKTTNYLDNIMARREAGEAGADDAVMLNESGRAACASAANIFVLTDDGSIVTPPVAEGALPGVVRKLLLEQGVGAFNIREDTLVPSALRGRLVFLTNSLMGVRPAHLDSDGALQRAGEGGLLSALRTWYKEKLEQDIEERARLF